MGLKVIMIPEPSLFCVILLSDLLCSVSCDLPDELLFHYLFFSDTTSEVRHSCIALPMEKTMVFLVGLRMLTLLHTTKISLERPVCAAQTLRI
ncbi:unnamed protein product [Dicrocoelium dendriticum]|nr:unnamed protein product [Dicrocoelium dendriticum]